MHPRIALVTAPVDEDAAKSRPGSPPFNFLVEN